MKRALIIAVPVVALLTLFAWSLSRLSSDAIGMALGLSLGVLAGVPSAALVLLARRRDDEDDDWQPTIIDYPQAPVYADQVTPYTQLARRVMQLPEFPDRRAEIDMLRAAADYLESEVRR